ncbi:MAG: aspartate kinase [Amoebophilaceae bacterium]|jgi:aspartate kinase|nr:aspartate kinase [Amoebophilaceae bacterium]
MKVFKFGGACLQHSESVRKLEQLVTSEQSRPLIVVVSAMGKTTQGLEDIFQKKIAAQPYDVAIQHLYQFHQDIIDHLLRRLRQEAYRALALWQEQLLETLAHTTADDTLLDKFYSKVVAGGELIASQLIDCYLQERNVTCAWLDARKCIRTNGAFCNAQVDWTATQHGVRESIGPLLKKNQVVLTQGFIGSNDEGETTTLGKEGSDFTGAILAAILGAQSLTIWKDVPGIMSADPKLFKKAIKFEHISYKAMAEMAFYGAKVLHPKTIQPLAAHHIPLYVKPFHRFHETGTEVADGVARVGHPVYTLRKDQVLIQLSLEDLTFFDEEYLGEVLHQLTKHNVHTNVLERSAYTLSICLDASHSRVGALSAALNQKFRTRYYARVHLLTVIGKDENLPNTFLKGKEILLSQQSGDICQLVFHHQQQEEVQKD